ncbi:MAG: cytochrome c [Chitinophagales bacterium]|nr:cytochrome c [Chitinophagales bacterium]
MKWLFVILAFTIIISGCYDTPYMQGQRLYQAHCQNCHMEDGSGLKSLIKPLNSSAYLGDDAMVCIIRRGILDTIFNDKDFLPKEMPAFKKLSVVEMANLVNYINNKWQVDFKEKTILDIEAAVSQCDTADY